MLEDVDQLSGAIGKAFLLMINVLMLQRTLITPPGDYPADFAPQVPNLPDIQFDFIIVGAGTAGSVLANRLTQIGRWSVLVVEAGHDPSPSTEVPALYPTLKNTMEDWGFAAVSDERSCLGMTRKRCKLHKGRALGGTSTINNMHYSRGNAHDYEQWEDYSGPDWGPEDVEFFFERLENYTGLQEHPSSPGRGGDIALSQFNSDHSIKDLIYASAKEIGYQKLEGRQALGYTDVVGTLKESARYNMAEAFLNPVKKRHNLFLIKNAFATKIIVANSTEKRVKGVDVFIKDRVYTLRAKKEVIVACGAINTPKLLLLSGIGPRALLRKLDIPRVADLPVGHDLQVHLSAALFVGLGKSADFWDQQKELIDNTYLFTMYRRGPFTTTNINDLVGFLNTRKTPYSYPNVAMYHYYFRKGDFCLKTFLEGIGYHQSVIRSLQKLNRNQSVVMFQPTLLKPRSRGIVTLNSKNPFDPPRVDAQFLSHEEDVQVLLSGMRYAIRIADTRPFRERNASVLYVDIPNCRNFKPSTERYFRCVIANVAFPQNEMAGTTRMGAKDCGECVLDPDLKVKGVLGLRAVGEGAMPVITSGNTVGPVAMMADKASEIIKAKWIKNYTPQPCCRCKTKYN